jgi:hypothetical protein
MNNIGIRQATELGPRLREWPLPGKALVTMIVLMMSIGMGGALGQIIVHDIVPTFWGKEAPAAQETSQVEEVPATRGDLFAETTEVEKEAIPFHETDEFIFALKFTHLHLFGMSGIFILMGVIVLFLEASIKTRTWLIVLPFIGIIVDLASVWLKIFIHPAFFWLHIPGGLLFGVVFAIQAVMMLRETLFSAMVDARSYSTGMLRYNQHKQGK